MNIAIKQFALALSLLAAPSLVAQNGGSDKTPAEKAAHHTQRMTKELGLSPEQSAKVGDINLRFAEALEDMKGNTAEKAEKKEQAMGMKERRDEELKQALTTDQYDRMLELRQQKKAEMKAQGKAKKGASEPHPHNE